MNGFATPKPEAAKAIENKFGRVPGPLFVAAVHRRRMGAVPCSSCDNPIRPGDEYISEHTIKGVITACSRCIVGTNSLSGDNAWPLDRGKGAVTSLDTESVGSDPEGSVKPGESMPEGPREARGTFAERGIARRLEEQNWRCAYPCEDGETTGGKFLPGQFVALGYDNHGLIHLDCAKYGVVPSEGNPWKEEDVDGEKS